MDAVSGIDGGDKMRHRIASLLRDLDRVSLRIWARGLTVGRGRTKGRESMVSPHDAAAMHIDQKYGMEFNRGPGPDIVTPAMDIEVETALTVKEAFRELERSRRPAYVAGVDDFTTRLALAFQHGSPVGVMDQYGNIRRHSSR